MRRRRPGLRVGPRIQQDDIVAVQQVGVTLKYDRHPRLVAETQPGAAVGQGIGAHSAAAFNAAPMPPPMSRYRPSPTAAGSSPAAFLSPFSSASVPLLSPRETKGAFAAAIVVRP